MSMFSISDGQGLPGSGVPDLNPQKAAQACLTCRKQKRKCSKALPACALCERMNRHCDYSDSTPPPTNEDFNILRNRLMELESRLNTGNGVLSPPSTFAPTPASSLSAPENLGQPTPAAFNSAPPPTQDYTWQVPNRFPAIAFLDSDSFKHGGVSIPKPAIDIPVDVLDLLGDATAIQTVIFDYFNTVHKWMPVVSQKRLTRNMANPLWEAGPDLALLFLAMKLITSRPQDGIESSHNQIYMSSKRFLAMMEASGTVSMLVLQAGLLITWYEYGQAIYPAAWMSAGWCVRFGNMLGISGHASAAQLLNRPSTWTEQEEWRRTWWGILVADRIVSLGSQQYILTNQEPTADTLLPVNDTAWDEGEMSHAIQMKVSAPIEEPCAPFPRICQASVLLGKVFSHHHGEKYSTEALRFSAATQLYVEVSALARKLSDEAVNTQDYLSLATPLALTHSTLFTLCEPYSCPTNMPTTTQEASSMTVQAVDGLKATAASVVHFAEQINTSTPAPQDLDRVSPIIMDALYSAAANYAWVVRESGDESSQLALDSLRRCLGRLGTRWRNAAEYLRILEAQEFTYMVGGAAA